MLGDSEYESSAEENDNETQSATTSSPQKMPTSTKGIRKFTKEMRTKLQSEYPNAKSQELNKMIKRRWEELSDFERKSLL